jgi:hypothetical protein
MGIFLRSAGSLRMGGSRRIAVWLAILLFVVSSPPQLRSQALQGITGTVTDATGAIVPNANVTATNNATGVSKTGTTSSRT